MFSRKLIRSTIKANEVLNDTLLLLGYVTMYRKDCDKYIMVYALVSSTSTKIINSYSQL